MIDYKIDRNCDGLDVFFDGQYVGKISFGDLRVMPQDRRPVTMLTMDKSTKHHDNLATAKEYVEAVYKQGVTA